MKLRGKVRMKSGSDSLAGTLLGLLVGYWVLGPILWGLIVLAFFLWLLS